jgi:hypothetical protein
MNDVLNADTLMSHVRALAEDIGPRPAGHWQTIRARRYIQRVLYELGYDAIETVPFRTPDTWGYSLANPLVLGLASNFLPARLLGGAIALLSGLSLWHTTRIGRSPLAKLAPRRPSATLIVRVPPAMPPCHKLVLVAHVDSNKDRPMFMPRIKKLLLGATTFGIGALGSNGVAQLAEGLGAGEGAAKMRRFSALALGIALLTTFYDEKGEYIHGANDNASAVACVLGLAAQLRQRPLAHTEVWLAFTGAEEVGCLGLHALLDAHGDDLRDAFFLDLEMVGTEAVAYVTRHTGFSLLSAYTPDAASLAWATSTARQHLDLGVTGRAMVIGEEVGALRLRGYRGLCLAGYGPDGWLANWHQASDTAVHIVPSGLEKAARFAWGMMQALDAR